MITILNGHLSKEKKLIVSYGLNSYLSFETLPYSSLEKETVLIRSVPYDTIKSDKNFDSEKQVIRKSKNLTYVDNAHSISKRRFDDESNEMAFDQPSEQPKTDNVALLLSQSLKSEDKKTLNYILQIRKPDTINKTVEKLHPNSIMSLVSELMTRLTNKSEGAVTAMCWMNSVLVTHMTYLMNTSSVKELFEPLKEVLSNRTRMHHKLFMLIGKIDLVEEQIKRASSDGYTEINLKAEAVYDDESTDNEDESDMDIDEFSVNNEEMCSDSD